MQIRHAVIAIFPGRDEKEKLNAVFASAPPWLIWFTFADYTAHLLGLQLPDLSSVNDFARSKVDFDVWWGIPSGAFERRRWPYGPESEPLSHVDLSLLHPVTPRSNGEMTRREQRRALAVKYQIKRADGWPHLLRPEMLEMPVQQQLALFHQAGLLDATTRNILIASGDVQERIAE